MAGLLGDATNALGNRLYEAFVGKPAPGTDARKLSDLQQTLKQTALQSAIEEARKKTPETAARQQLDLLFEAGKKANLLATDRERANLGLAPDLLRVLGEKTSIGDNSYINRLKSETTSRKDLMDAEGDQRLRLLGGTPVELEKYLADSDASLARDYFAYASQAQERGIKAQQQGRVLPFIGGLLATAASLFA